MHGDEVLIGVDPHKASNTLAVLDPATRVVVASKRFTNTASGFEELRSFADQWADHRWAVEGCHGAGRSLAQRLVSAGEVVFDVPAKLAARVRVYSQGHGRKTDLDDAVSVGTAALLGDGIARVHSDDALVSLRLLSDRRAELVALRTQAVCRLHRLLVELTPGGLARKLGADKALRTLALLRPDTAVDVVRVQLAHEHVADIQTLDTKIKTVSRQIGELVTASGTHLTDLYGIGPVIAGRILAEVENINRFPSRHHFASYNGTAPIDASSGEQIRHRLSRAGNRRLNHALHMMAVTQIRQPNSPGRGYYERKRLEGKTPKEALRCLKRRLSDVVYCQLVADRASTIDACESPTTATPTPPTFASPRTNSSPAARPSRPSSRPASTAGSCSTGKTTASSASKSSTPTPGSIKTSSIKPRTSRTTRSRAHS
jgi:transposase